MSTRTTPRLDDLPDDVYVELAGILYRAPRSVVAVIITAAIAAIFLATQIGGVWSPVAAALACAACLARAAILWTYPYATSADMTRSQAQTWAWRYGVGSAGQNVAMTALCVLAFVEDPLLAVAPFGWAMATSIGASTRTAVIPWITVSSAVILLVPLALGALLRPEPAVRLAGVFALVNLYATIECARYLNRAFLDRLLTQREVSHQATHDALTGLLNRRAFEQHLTAACTSGCPGALLALDLDDFKPINDTLGHAAGDEILRQVAARLRTAVGQAGISARTGGDEFLVLVDDPASARRVAERIVAGLCQAYSLEGSTAQVGVSVGLAVWTGQDAGRLTREADEALYRAKRGGRGRYAVANADVAAAA